MQLDKNIFTEELEHLFKILSGDKDKIRLVGGCVRDFIIGRKIDDYDLATRHRPDQLVSLLDKNGLRHLDLGKQFGTITVILNGKKFEITSLRKDIRPDGRHTTVEFTDDYREDAQRRDFTFNALYCDSNCKIYDYFGGIGDLKKGLLRFIGDPEERILEDHLRILRFFRFYASHCYFMDWRALAACQKHRDRIDRLSRERVGKEVGKILECNYPLKALKTMEHCGILQKIFSYRDKMDFSSLEIFCSLRNYLDFEYNYLFIEALLASRNKIKFDLALQKKEKIYLNHILENIPEYLDNSAIEKLLFKLSNKNLVKAIVLVYICNNFTESYSEQLDFLARAKIPELDITTADLKKCGFRNEKEYGKLLQRARNIFIGSNFRAEKKNIMEMLREAAK
jgi:poly(A) polymerase